jgi:hypothetical protein
LLSKQVVWVELKSHLGEATNDKKEHDKVVYEPLHCNQRSVIIFFHLHIDPSMVGKEESHNTIVIFESLSL